jgi:23S rRNA pseudouridine1911/1915/1917 synthase
MAKRVVIDEETKGKRADVLVTGLYPALSRSYVHRLFDEERIKLNSAEVKPGYKLRLGDKLSIDFDLKELDQIPDIELPILYEDENIIVVDKPSGVISHSRGKYWDEPSVASFMRQKTGQPGERSGIVHRLDRATSGVMVCAKNQETLSHLQKQFSQRGVKKTYYAVISGHIEPQEAIIDMPIDRNPAKPQTFYVTYSGKTAQTAYRVVKSYGNYDEVELEPHTGRTHQLRVHLKQLGHPIVGDQLYGGEEAPRLFLHATSLEITLPGGKRQVFTSPLPPEFKEFRKKHVR